MIVLLLILALVGHGFLWVALVNRLHATGLGPRFCRMVALAAMVGFLAIPVAAAWEMAGAGPTLGHGWLPFPAWSLPYLVACWLAAPVALVAWTRRTFFRPPPQPLRWDRRRLDRLLGTAAPAGSDDHRHHFVVRLPGNQTLHLGLVERGLDVAGLPPALDRLALVHLSDFHFTGRVGKAYFQEVVERVNRLEPDLVAITGDLVDRAECIEWIPDTLGRLRGRFGVYFVLGNHDLKVDTRRLRAVLVDSGLIDLGGRRQEVEVRGVPVLLAGNELPWIPPAADFGGAPPPLGQGGPLRIALSHSPDQLDWARRHEVNLLLAGHLHGGQIRLPLIGPIMSPSRRGVTYASGVFYHPPTILHVSRGLSGELPFRFRCPPEIVRLVLHGED